MINKMMDAMIKTMLMQEREEMMQQMMPEMMKRVDVKIMVPNMLEMLVKKITPYGVYGLISRALKDKEQKETPINSANNLENCMKEII